MQLFVSVPSMCSSLVVEVPSSCTVSDLLRAVACRCCDLDAFVTGGNRVRCYHNGRALPRGKQLSHLGVAHGSGVELLGCLRGGGGDGGSTGAESRSSYLDMYKEKKAGKVDPLQARRAKWTCCSFSGKPLQPPVVADEAGALFNKVEMVLGLQARKVGDWWPDNLAHVARLKDLLPVKPTENKNYSPDRGTDAERPTNEAPFECPVAGVPLNGAFRGLVHRPTGVLLSDKAVKQAPAAVRGLLLDAAAAALKGGAPGLDAAALSRVVALEGGWAEGDWLVVNPEGPDAEAARDRVEMIVAKKSKKKVGATNGTTKRPQPAAAAPAAKRMKNGVLDSLFHEDGEGARVQETFLCRSVGARGMNLT